MINVVISFIFFIGIGYAQVHKGPGLPITPTKSEVCNNRMLDILASWKKCDDVSLSEGIDYKKFNDELKEINDKMLVELLLTNATDVGDFCKEHDLPVPSPSKGKLDKCTTLDMDEYLKKVKLFRAEIYNICLPIGKETVDEVANNLLLHGEIIPMLNKAKKTE